VKRPTDVNPWASSVPGRLSLWDKLHQSILRHVAFAKSDTVSGLKSDIPVSDLALVTAPA